MKYAGPREAVHHAIMRNNFGCTHIIIGRDHAGIGQFYAPYEAQEIFKEFPDLGITPLFFREFFYCRLCEAVVNERICPHSDYYRVRISGTQLREMVLKGEMPPKDYIRPSVARVILSHPDPFVEGNAVKRRASGFVIWLTGLPGSGKTTIANSLRRRLLDSGFRIELLDGDEVRRWLSPEAGFSREDKERHLRRVAHVSRLLARNGVVVIASFISPYTSIRQYAKNLIGDFVEVYVKASLETCIKRDPKGLFKKALSGEITNVTGLQDAYEKPENPDVVLDTEILGPEEAVDLLMAKLKDMGYVNRSE